MQHFEYTVIPAPSRGEKVRGARTGAERFSYALLTEMNRMAANGWEYVRAETLPCEERSGLTSRTTVFHNVLVFRRAVPVAQAQHPIVATHEQPSRPAPRAVSAATQDHAPPPAPAAARPDSEPPSHWPDAAPTDHAEGTGAAPLSDESVPAFAPADAPTPLRSDRFEAPELPAFVQRPPLAGPRAEGARTGVFSEPMAPAGGNRLGPAER